MLYIKIHTAIKQLTLTEVTISLHEKKNFLIFNDRGHCCQLHAHLNPFAIALRHKTFQQCYRPTKINKFLWFWEFFWGKNIIILLPLMLFIFLYKCGSWPSKDIFLRKKYFNLLELNWPKAKGVQKKYAIKISF